MRQRENDKETESLEGYIGLEVGFNMLFVGRE